MFLGGVELSQDVFEQQDELMVEPPEPISIAQSLLPLVDSNTKKAEYLAYRIASFSKREACKLANVNPLTIKRWVESDPQFAAIEVTGLTALRQKFGNEYLNMEFTRNFHLVLQQDFKVLFKAVRDKPMTPDETDYLKKIRPYYTPQHLAIIKQLAGEVEKDKQFDFTQLTLTIRREKEEMTITRKES
jgi:hypothetical protein